MLKIKKERGNKKGKRYLKSSTVLLPERKRKGNLKT